MYHFGDNALISYKESHSEKYQESKCLLFTLPRRKKTVIEEIKEFTWRKEGRKSWLWLFFYQFTFLSATWNMSSNPFTLANIILKLFALTSKEYLIIVLICNSMIIKLSIFIYIYVPFIYFVVSSLVNSLFRYFAYILITLAFLLSDL